MTCNLETKCMNLRKQCEEYNQRQHIINPTECFIDALLQLTHRAIYSYR